MFHWVEFLSNLLKFIKFFFGELWTLNFMNLEGLWLSATKLSLKTINTERVRKNVT